MAATKHCGKFVQNSPVENTFRGKMSVMESRTAKVITIDGDESEYHSFPLNAEVVRCLHSPLTFQVSSLVIVVEEEKRGHEQSLSEILAEIKSDQLAKVWRYPFSFNQKGPQTK